MRQNGGGWTQADVEWRKWSLISIDQHVCWALFIGHVMNRSDFDAFEGVKHLSYLTYLASPKTPTSYKVS